MNRSDDQLFQALQTLGPLAKTALQEFVTACAATREKREAELAARGRLNGKALFQRRSTAIVASVASAFDVPPADVTGPSRERHHVVARWVAMYLMRCHLGWSSPRIAKACGRKDHTTVLNGWRAVDRLLQQDEVFRNIVLAVSAQCRKCLGQNGADPMAVMHNAEALGNMRAALEAHPPCPEHGCTHLVVCGRCLTRVQCALCEPLPCGCEAKQTC